MKKVTVFVVLMGSLFGLTTSKSGVCQDILFTDADAGARIICRNDQDAAACFTPFGDATNIRVHDQNSSISGYWHFDLSDVDSNANVLGARFQLDLQSNSWSDNTSVSVFAIVDTNKDWDLNELPETEIIGAIAPQSDYTIRLNGLVIQMIHNNGSMHRLHFSKKGIFPVRRYDCWKSLSTSLARIR